MSTKSLNNSPVIFQGNTSTSETRKFVYKLYLSSYCVYSTLQASMPAIALASHYCLCPGARNFVPCGTGARIICSQRCKKILFPAVQELFIPCGTRNFGPLRYKNVLFPAGQVFLIPCGTKHFGPLRYKNDLFFAVRELFIPCGARIFIPCGARKFSFPAVQTMFLPCGARILQAQALTIFVGFAYTGRRTCTRTQRRSRA